MPQRRALPGLFTEEVPTVDDFRWRGHHASTILGNYLYFDGGEISQFINGKTDAGTSRQVNSTIAIPLDKKWTPSDVTLTSTVRVEAPNTKQETILGDPSTGRVYAWGGEGPYNNRTGSRNRKLWIFTPDSKGKGTWADQDPPNEIVRTAGASSTACGGKLYILGGYTNYDTDTRQPTQTKPVAGLITYDPKTKAWANETVPASYSTNILGRAACLPFGSPSGVVAFFGGANTSAINADTEARREIPFDTVTMWNPATKTWLSQNTRGEKPTPRQYFCSASVKGANSTEIYIYGGYNQQGDNSGFADVHVLTIPGFQWFKTKAQGGLPRIFGTCEIQGRHLISVGGLPTWKDSWSQTNPSKDPWLQGVGVLDLVSMQWSHSFDPAAGPYESPADIKDWYTKNALSTIPWTDDTVKSLFANGTTSPDPVAPPPPAESSSNNAGAIAGGVVGGLAIIALVAVAIWWILRRRKSRHNGTSADAAVPFHPGQHTELDSNGPPQPYSDHHSQHHPHSSPPPAGYSSPPPGGYYKENPQSPQELPTGYDGRPIQSPQEMPAVAYHNSPQTTQHSFSPQTQTSYNGFSPPTNPANEGYGYRN